MVKAEFKVICRIFGIKPKALRERMKEENIKRKNATKKEVLDVVFVNSTDLMYSRSIGNGEVEYLEPDMPRRLSRAMAEERGDTQ
jgi:hypothetical protein